MDLMHLAILPIGKFSLPNTLDEYCQLSLRLGNMHIAIVLESGDFSKIQLHTDWPAEFDKNGKTRGSRNPLLIPTNVSDSHWMLCVCPLPPHDLGIGTITFYNSLASEYWARKCYQAANNVARFLQYFGRNSHSRLSGIT